MEFGILGPMAMRSQGASLLPSPPKTRQLLALLLVNAHTTVSLTDCVDELWDCRPPRSAVQGVHTRVFQLRKALAPACAGPDGGNGEHTGSAGSGDAGGEAGEGARQILETRHQGYVLCPPAGSFDLDRWEERMRAARDAQAAGDDARLAATLRAALAVWRGPVLADVETGPLLRTHAAGLAARRLTVWEQCIEAELRLGLHHALLAELQMLVARHPAHENLHAQYMVALYRSGRAAQALDAYQSLRRTLRSELGMEPSASLQRLQSAVLSGSPGLSQAAHPSARLSVDLIAS